MDKTIKVLNLLIQNACLKYTILLPNKPGEVVKADHNCIVVYGTLYNLTSLGSFNAAMSDESLKIIECGIAPDFIASMISLFPSKTISSFFSLLFRDFKLLIKDL